MIKVHTTKINDTKIEITMYTKTPTKKLVIMSEWGDENA